MNRFVTGIAALAIAVLTAAPVSASETKIAWSHYTGWEPLGVIQSSGIMDKWNKEMGTDIEIVYIGDYVDSITLYAAGQFAGVAVTNMDVLAIAGVGGRASTVLIVGDYSDGNDGLILKGFASLDVVPTGTTISLVEYSVSHYLLARCLDQAGMNIDDFELLNITDADIPSLVASSDEVIAVSWNPMLMTIQNMAGVNVVCTSNQIPGEIIDMVVVGDEVTDVEKMALVGAWYEMMALIEARDPDTLAALAEQAGSSVADFESQLETTHMFYTPAAAVAFVNDPALKATMWNVVTFSFNAGIYDGVENAGELGVSFPNGDVMGDPDNVMLKFDISVTEVLAREQAINIPTPCTTC